MNTEQRIKIMYERLQSAFLPSKLEIIDDSHMHIGHAGAKGGAGHYSILIQANSFKDKTRVDVHRAIYQVLNDLIPHEIHAICIKIL
jgi:BolA family transcriptional regulator, general stress-responsive regulator